MKKNIDWKKFFDGYLYIKIENEYEHNLFLKSIPKKYEAHIHDEKYCGYDWIYGYTCAFYAVEFTNSSRDINWRYDQYVKSIKDFMTEKEIKEDESFKTHLKEQEEELKRIKTEKEEVRKLEEIQNQKFEEMMEKYILKELDDSNSKIYKKIASIAYHNSPNYDFDSIVNNRVSKSFNIRNNYGDRSATNYRTVLSYNDTEIWEK